MSWVHDRSMPLPMQFARQAALGLSYFATASLAILLTRYDGGVAFLWIATAFLIADLMIRPRRQWIGSIMPCAVASGLATGFFGFGWIMALPLVVINMAEAVIAAWIFRWQGGRFRPLGSLSWLMQFVISVGLVAPLIGAVLAAATLKAAGMPPGLTFLHYFAGHALGNITFTPLVLLFASGNIQKMLRNAHRRDVKEGFLLLLTVIVVSVFVFGHRRVPLLFLPVLPIIFVTVRTGRGGAAASIVLLALIGGGATMAGLGPIHLFAGSLGLQLQFFQIYLAVTVLAVLPVAADLQNRARLHRDVRLSEERYRILAEHSTDILLHLEVDGRIRYVSPSIRQLVGHDRGALIGQNNHILVAPSHLERVRQAHALTIAKAGETLTYEYLAVTAAGAERWFETHARAVLDEQGRIDGVVCLVRDISARKSTEQRLAEAAMTDALTGLPNRRAYRAEIERLRTGQDRPSIDCLAVLDIDHFKVVNDSFGHDVGDEVLRSFAKIARRMIREEDMLARIGGEEFAIFFPDTSIEQAMLVCDRLRAEMARSKMPVGDSIIQVTVSGGVAPLGPEGIDEALRIADLALYRAKRNGRDQFELAA